MTHLDAGQVRCSASTTTTSQQFTPSTITCTTVLSVVSTIEDYTNRDIDMEVINASEDVPNKQANNGDCDGEFVKTVQEPAVLLSGPQDAAALVGDRVLLKATYMGHPEPRVKWSRAVRGPKYTILIISVITFQIHLSVVIINNVFIP